MEFKIVEKNQSLNLTVESKQTGPKTFYFGAGWDMKGGQAVDLDLVVLHTTQIRQVKKNIVLVQPYTLLNIQK